MSKSDGGVRLTSALLAGPISWMARNSVAANLLMTVVLMLGIAGVLSIKQEVFPDFKLDMEPCVGKARRPLRYLPQPPPRPGPARSEAISRLGSR